MKRNRRNRPARSSKLDVLVAATVQDHAHRASSDIIRTRGALAFERGIVEAELSELASRVADAKALRRTIDAKLLGLGIVIGRR